MTVASTISYAAILLASHGLPAEDCAARLQRTVAVMGTTLSARICAQSFDAAAAATEAGFAEVRRLDGVLSSWTPTSEVGRVNGAGGPARRGVSVELYALLQEAGAWVRETGGAFDPAVGALIDVWGLRTGGRVPSEAELAAALKVSGWQHLQLCDSQTIVRGPAGWWLDTGGFGKGVALRNAAGVLKQHGVQQAELNFGGQLLVFGQEIEIAVADPRDRERAVLSLRVRDVSVATSSQSEHKPYGHIVDPRTGRPVAAWGSVTVVAADAMTADALSTALFVMGPRAALQWARNRTDVGVLILENISEQPRATWNDALSRMIIRSN